MMNEAPSLRNCNRQPYDKALVSDKIPGITTPTCIDTHPIFSAQPPNIEPGRLLHSMNPTRKQAKF